MVNGIERGGEIHKDKGCDRPFGHIKKIIVVNINCESPRSVEWCFL